MPSGTSTPTIRPPAAKSSTRARGWLGALWKKRVCVVPTWRGWAILILAVSALGIVGGRRLCDFLTVRDWEPGGILVIEGWVPPYAAREALDEFHRHAYLGIWVTGEPMEEGNPYVGYENYADFTAAKLTEMGAAPGSVHAVPAPKVARDRTYTTAGALKERLEAAGVSTARVTVVSVGPHSRRTRLLYEMSFGSGSHIGVIGVTPHEFDPNQWWTTSNGVRTVISEFVAYCYVRILFRSN